MSSDILGINTVAPVAYPVKIAAFVKKSCPRLTSIILKINWIQCKSFYPEITGAVTYV